MRTNGAWEGELELLLGVASLVLGLTVGSFLNVVIHRVPRRVFFSRGLRSRCLYCDARIAWFDNLPLLSWFLLRGRSRCCDKGIPVRYPIVEALTGLGFLWVFGRETGFSEAASLEQWARIALGFWLLGSLVAASAIDLEFRILPDAINFPGMALGLVASVLLPEIHEGNLVYRELQNLGPGAKALVDALAGMMAGGGTLYLVAVLGRVFYKRETMGLGDVKLMVFMGTLLGPGGVLLALVLACLLGAFFGLLEALRTGDPLIPFGPFLAGGSLAMYFHGVTVQRWFLVDWPSWLRSSSLGLPVMIGCSLLCAFAIVYLRRLRRR